MNARRTDRFIKRFSMFCDFLEIVGNHFQITVYIGIDPKPLSCWQDHDSNKHRRLSPMRQTDGFRVAR
jgi:hypothetical protein